jgi:nifR3 family TIM-barrel protein
MNIWDNLTKPILILAPMEDVTDTVFRRIIAECGKPDLFFTEFTNVDGLASTGDHVVAQRLLFTPEEKPIIAQIWGKNPEHYYRAARRIASMGFDGIDINMGCPEKSVIKHGCCIALINNRPLASEIINATKQGAGHLPVSVKTRIGLHSIITEDWISFLLSHDICALTIHGRTAAQLSLPPAHWEEIQKSVQIRDKMKKRTYIIGNGDVLSKEEAIKKFQTFGVDGVMIGRGIFRNPYLFGNYTIWEHAKPKEKLLILKQHVQLFHSVWGEKKNFSIMKKYVKIYVSEFPQASEIREELMNTQNAQAMLARIEEIIKSL